MMMTSVRSGEPPVKEKFYVFLTGIPYYS